MRTAVVLFNLGGPDCPEAVQPFLFNLFNDPAIINLPTLVRWPLGQIISRRRAPVAQKIYAEIGGRSPIGELTNDQAQDLENRLNGQIPGEFKCFVAMRYWHPRSSETVQQVKAFAPDRIVLLPLYPQFSTTTTGSSVKEWRETALAEGLEVPTTIVCCYPGQAKFIDAHVDLLREALRRMVDPSQCRVLFSAHGLPKRIVEAGDPYRRQVEETAKKIVEGLGQADLDWMVCFQSRVGPLEWIGPSTEECIKQAGSDKKGLVIVPIAFVSEHSETLVELDIEYAKLAKELGVPDYVRVPALGTSDTFVDALREIVQERLAANDDMGPATGFSPCAGDFGQCPLR